MLLEGPELSIIIPTLNEADQIGQTLWPLQSIRRRGVEIILIDGGSRDHTLEVAEPLVDQLVQTRASRALQMNLGAELATGRILLFLHADTQLPDDAYEAILQKMELPHVWGRFDVSLSGEQPMLRMVENLMNVRSGLTGIATGDQAIFVSRHAFFAVGGYPNIPLMEDIAISKRLKKIAFPVCLRQRVVTSSRKWETQGIFKTITTMWWLRLLYFIGVKPDYLHARYYGSQNGMNDLPPLEERH